MVSCYSAPMRIKVRNTHTGSFDGIPPGGEAWVPAHVAQRFSAILHPVVAQGVDRGRRKANRKPPAPPRTVPAGVAPAPGTLTPDSEAAEALTAAGWTVPSVD